VTILEKAVVITGMTKQYSNGRGIQNIDLSIDQGEIVGILGPNGAGKTTLLKCLTGLTSPDSGKVELFGVELQSNYKEAIRPVGALIGPAVAYENMSDDYLVKPFSPNEMVARVKAHLSRYERLSMRQTTESQGIYIRGLFIDRSSRRVFVNNKEITLTTKEFDVLTFLALNPDQVFSKDHLFERIWGYDSNGDVSTVTVHIRKIREKIEHDPSNPEYIETVWGSGYRFH
jgi:ABC-type branched-subunit amino acid transport system ATPase component